MTPTLATRFLPGLVEQMAMGLCSESERERLGQRAAAGELFAALNRDHVALQSSIGLIGSALAGLEARRRTAPAATGGLSQALEMFRAQRRQSASWLDLYCTTTDTIEQINFRSTKPLTRLNDDQRELVMSLARAACDFIEVGYNRDFDAAGMAVTCDRLVELGVSTKAEAFRVATLRQRFESAGQLLMESRARWTAAFEAMALRLEHERLNAAPPKSAASGWLDAFNRRRWRADAKPASAGDVEIRVD